MAQENLAAPPAILHRDKDGRPVVLVERWLVELPCGHTTRRTPESIEARAQYVCGRCMGLYGQWVEGRLDPEWVREEAPVRAVKPPPRPPAEPGSSQEERVNAGMDHVRALIAAEGMCSTDRYDATRPALAYSSRRHMERAGYETWAEMDLDCGGMAGPTAFADVKWERNRPKAFALLNALWDEKGRPPYFGEYKAAARSADLPTPGTLQKREGLSWHGLIYRLAEERMNRREAA